MDLLDLTAAQGRVLGSLVEKQLTTPQQYPLSLNALVLACNQTSNRDPVVTYGEPEVEAALAALKDRQVVRFVLPSHGRSVVRYRHVLDEVLGVDGRQVALLAVLLLRGPQTVGELRIRTERMAVFDDLGDVERELQSLTVHAGGLVERLARRPGQKEERWAQRLMAVGDGTAGRPGAVAGGPEELTVANGVVGGSDAVGARPEGELDGPDGPGLAPAPVASSTGQEPVVHPSWGVPAPTPAEPENEPTSVGPVGGPTLAKPENQPPLAGPVGGQTPAGLANQPPRPARTDEPPLAGPGDRPLATAAHEQGREVEAQRQEVPVGGRSDGAVVPQVGPGALDDGPAGLRAQLGALQDEMAGLRAVVAQLQDELAELRESLGG